MSFQNAVEIGRGKNEKEIIGQKPKRKSLVWREAIAMHFAFAIWSIYQKHYTPLADKGTLTCTKEF